MLIVGLTGGIGAGKSSACRLLASKGAVVLDADALAREAVEPGTEAHRAVVERFGAGVLSPQGGLDRKRIAELVFHDGDALSDLNAITHPAVGALMAQRMEEVARREAEEGEETVVILDIPLLSRETRGRYPMAGVIVVDAPDDLRLSRLVTSRAMTLEDARARMAAQASRDDRLALADFVVDNSGDLDLLAEQVDGAWGWITILRERLAGSAEHP